MNKISFAYEEVIEVLKSGDSWIEYYRDWIKEKSYEDEVLLQLQDLGIVEIKLEVDEDKLKKFKDIIEFIQNKEREDE